MDRVTRRRLVDTTNSKMYLDLKGILRENALQFLPAKSLFKFRSVCRDWKHAISTPFFAHNQSNSCRMVLGFFSQPPDGPPSFVSVDPAACGVPDPSLSFLPEPVEIRSSSNGLVCCQGKDKDKAYYVCNPVLKQYKKVPKPNVNHGNKPAVVLVFEPSLLNFVAEYKLICAFPSNDFDDATEFDIYSSRTGRWETSGEISFAKLKLDPTSGYYANGVVYWRGDRLIAYDLVKDRCTLLSQYDTYGKTVMGTFQGAVCTVSSSNGGSLTVQALGNVHSNTMQMGSVSRLWKVKKTFKFNEVSGDSLKDCSVLAISGKYALIGNEKKLYTCDLLNDTQTAQTPVGNHRLSVWLPYVNTLASLEF